MASRRNRPGLVIPLVAGAVLTVATSACADKDMVATNPPEPDPPPTMNPPPPEPPEPPPAEVSSLPSWDDVASGHPEGATNPPSPTLLVSEDGTRCWKEWNDPRRKDPAASTHGGKVVADEAAAEGATEIACPDQAKDVVASWAAASAEEAAPEGEAAEGGNPEGGTPEGAAGE